MPNRCYSDLKFNHMIRPKSSTCHTFHSVYRTNRNASYSIPIRVHSALFKDNASKLSGEMRRDKRARHRYRIDKPCIGGTQLQELHCEQTVWLSSPLLRWEMQMSSLPNDGRAQLWVAWRRQVCGPRWLCRRTKLRLLWHEQRVWENGKSMLETWEDILATVTVQNQYTRSHVTPNVHKPSSKGLHFI